MGSSNSILTHDLLEEYVQLTYLTKAEIVYVFQKFSKICGTENNQIEDLYFRYKFNDVTQQFPQLKFNPFQDRLLRVFSSKKDDCLSFEDFLDLSSAMSINCPLRVKAAWAFKVFDFDEDNQITKNDLHHMIDRIILGSNLRPDEKEWICDILLKSMDLQHTGGMSQIEFLHAMTKMPEFANAFSFRL